MQTITLADGRQLAYSISGKPDGLPLLFHHGTPFTRYASPEGPIAEAGFRLIRFSRPGYGHSDSNPGRKIIDIAGDVRQLIDHLEVERFHVYGWSGGGPHALATAAALPDRVMGCAVLGGIAPFDAEGLNFLAGMGQDNLDEFGATIQGMESLERYLGNQMPGMQNVTADDLISVLGSLLPDVDRKVLNQTVAEEMAFSIREALEPGMDGWRDDDIAFTREWGFDLDALKVPLAVWWGDEDRMVPAPHGRWLADNLPGARPYFLKGEGHISLIERHMAAFLNSLKEPV